MSPPQERHGFSGAGVLVGVDGSPSSLEALDWAADEAVLRGLTLHIAVCAHVPAFPDSFGAPVGPLPLDVPVPDRHILAEAEERVAARGKPPPVRAQVIPDVPVRGLLRAARDAQLVVVGSRGHGRVAGLLLGSTALQLAIHAPCPITVVRPRTALTNRPFAGHVVVGVDGSEPARAAIAAGFEEADRRRLPLAAVSVRRPQSTDRYLGTQDKPHQAALTAEIEPWARKYPHVAVRSHVLPDTHPAVALQHASAGAELLVVGSRGRGGFRGLLLGSVSLALTQRAFCPVLIAHQRRQPPRHD